MGAERVEAQQPSIGTDGAEQGGWGAIPLSGNQFPDLPWAGAEPEESASSATKYLRHGLILLAAVWLGVTAWSTFTSGGSQGLASAVQWLALASGPLALMGLAWLLFGPSARSDDDRFARAASSVRAEGAELDRVLAAVTARIEEKHGTLTDEAAKLMALGDEASDRLGRVAHYLSKEGSKLDARTAAIEKVAQYVEQELGLLLTDLPKAEERARQVAETMKEAGLAAHQQAGALEGQLAALAARGREADEVVGGAAQRLGAHLDRVESTTEAATARIQAAAAAMSATVDGSMAQAADAVDAARAGLEAQGAAMLALIEQSRVALAQPGDDANREVSERLERMAGQVETMRSSVQQLQSEFGASSDRAAALIERAERMSGMLTGLGAQLEGDMPAALGRIESQAERARMIVSSIAPEVEGVAGSAESAAQRLREAEMMLASQQQALETMLAKLGAGVGTVEEQIRALTAAAAEADAAAGRIAADTGPELIEALVRVREAAAQAAERAREAIAAVIPESAAALGEASRKAIGQAVGGEVRQQMQELELLAERSVDAARRASERLTRQMLTIGETTAAVEERIDETRKQREAKESESFSRRVALLIESLNSTAIDVTKILSNEVTDSAWAAYLKGDRGVFTRRAVRLIDAAEAREILAHYEAEPEFREQVNRYIHDFEAMLRRVLADRDSSALGVTLLGSDMGKLYVALAQAIDRIRA
jgi:hypothetical protein